MLNLGVIIYSETKVQGGTYMERIAKVELEEIEEKELAESKAAEPDRATVQRLY